MNTKRNRRFGQENDRRFVSENLKMTKINRRRYGKVCVRASKMQNAKKQASNLQRNSKHRGKQYEPPQKFYSNGAQDQAYSGNGYCGNEQWKTSRIPAVMQRKNRKRKKLINKFVFHLL